MRQPGISTIEVGLALSGSPFEKEEDHVQEIERHFEVDMAKRKNPRNTPNPLSGKPDLIEYDWPENESGAKLVHQLGEAYRIADGIVVYLKSQHDSTLNNAKARAAFFASPPTKIKTKLIPAPETWSRDTRFSISAMNSWWSENHFGDFEDYFLRRQKPVEDTERLREENDELKKLLSDPPTKTKYGYLKTIAILTAALLDVKKSNALGTVDKPNMEGINKFLELYHPTDNQYLKSGALKQRIKESLAYLKEES